MIDNDNDNSHNTTTTNNNNNIKTNNEDPWHVSCAGYIIISTTYGRFP